MKIGGTDVRTTSEAVLEVQSAEENRVRLKFTGAGPALDLVADELQDGFTGADSQPEGAQRLRVFFHGKTVYGWCQAGSDSEDVYARVFWLDQLKDKPPEKPVPRVDKAPDEGVDAQKFVGRWVLVSMEKLSGEPGNQPLAEERTIRIEKGAKGMVVVFEGGSKEQAIPFSLARHGHHYIGKLTVKDAPSVGMLIEIEENEARVCTTYEPQPPTDFSTSATAPDAKTLMRLKKYQPCVFQVTGPIGAEVSIGTWSSVLEKEKATVSTVPLSPTSETYWDVKLSTSISGTVLRDRIRLWVKGGDQVSADFSDLRKPDAATRTLRFWEHCIRHYRSGMKSAGSEKAGEGRDRVLKQMTEHIRSVPVRGVDELALHKWHSFATAADNAISFRESAFGLEYLVESLARGTQGDPFGAAQERMAEIKGRSREVIEALQSIRRLTPTLTLKYDTEFPTP